MKQVARVLKFDAVIIRRLRGIIIPLQPTAENGGTTFTLMTHMGLGIIVLQLLLRNPSMVAY